MVDIFVGPEKVRYRLHKKMLCSKIPYFDKILNGGFKEAKEGTAHLPEDDPDAFDMMCGWVYSGKLVDLEIVLGKDGVGTINWDLNEVYIMAEKLCLPQLMDTVMDMLRAHHQEVNELPSPDFVHQAYSRTADNSSLQKYTILGLKFAITSENRIPPYLMPRPKLEELEEKVAKSPWQTSAIRKLLAEHDNFARDFISSIRNEDASMGHLDPRFRDDCHFHTHSFTDTEKVDCPLARNKRKLTNKMHEQQFKRARVGESYIGYDNILDEDDYEVVDVDSDTYY